MRRKSKKNLEISSSEGQNSSNPVENGHLDAGNEKTVKIEVGNELKSVDKNGQRKSSEKVKNDEPQKSTCGVSFTGVLKVIILVIIVPPFLNYASLQREAASLESHGEMHDGPRGKLFMHCSGRGLPVVMMDTPGGCSSDMWSLVQSQIAKFTKVCVYDRAGLGFSEKATQHFHENQHSNVSSGVPKLKYEQLRPTTENMVTDLRHLLQTLSNNTNDIILVGGGLGEVNVRFYARFYEDIFGIVLINPFHGNIFDDEVWLTFWYDNFIPSLQIDQLLAFLGVTRLGIITRLYKPSILENEHFENDVMVRLKYLSCNSQHLSAGIMEHYYTNESMVQLKILEKLKHFPSNISVSLISSKNFSNYLPSSVNKLWFKYQQTFAAESFPKNERIIVDGDFNTVYQENIDVLVKTIKKTVVRFRKSVKQSATM